MNYSSHYEDLQRELISYYQATGRYINYPELSYLTFLRGHAIEGFPEVDHTILQDLSEETFQKQIRLRSLPVYDPTVKDTEEVKEDTVFPSNFDVYLLQQFYCISGEMHNHDYFELAYVYRGTCQMNFEKEHHELKEGELCIIAPGSSHGLRVPSEDDITMLIWIRKSTFNNTFFTLLSRKDLLSYFFQTMLYGKPQPNYLMFFTDNNQEIRNFIKMMFYNCMIDDNYSNSYCISLLNMLFVTVLRDYSKTIRFYNYSMGTDFSMILQYIQHNYLHLTLHELANIFHYSEAHLSVLIKRNTGHSFVELVTSLKMVDAAKYLSNTNMKIADIAYLTGYNSPDHFTRAFQRTYNMSPTAYRESMAQKSTPPEKKETRETKPPE